MGSVPELVAALALLGIMSIWDAREEERKSRQEEALVPFNLPALCSAGDRSIVFRKNLSDQLRP